MNSGDLKDVDEEKRDDYENVDAVKRKVDVTRETSDVPVIVNVDLYLGMELGLNKGDE